MASQLASAFVRIRPDSSGFKAEAETEVETAARGLSATARILLDDDVAKAKIKDMRATLARLGSTVATARTQVNDKDSQARLAKLALSLARLDAKVADPKIKLDGVVVAEAQLLGLDASIDKLNPKVQQLTKYVGGAGFSMESLSQYAIPGLIGVTAVLAPALVTIGTGLGGLAIGAEQTLAPVLKSKDGLTGLDSAQQAAYQSVQTLKGGVASFTHSLEPEVIDDFGKAVGLAGGLLHDLQPVASTTGKALGGVIDAAHADLQTPEWKQFFSFLAETAPQDVRLVSSALGNLANTLPPLLEHIQPLTNAFLGVTDAATKLAQLGATVAPSIDQTGQSADKASGSMRGLAGISHEVLINLETMGGASVIQAGEKLAGVGGSAGGASPKVRGLGSAAASAGASMETAAQKAADLETAMSKMVDPALNARDAELAAKTAAQELSKAMDASGGKIGFAGAKAQAALGKFDNLARSIEGQVKADTDAGGATDQQRKALETELGVLSRAAGHNRDLRKTVDELAWAIRHIPAEHSTVLSISERVTGGALPGAPVGVPVLRSAAGGRVPGYGGGDRWPALLEGGEAIVPKHLTPAVAPFLARHGVPGFAAGGLIGSLPSPVASGGGSTDTVRVQVELVGNPTSGFMSELRGQIRIRGGVHRALGP